MTFRGLTWDHPRGRHALESAAAEVNAGRETPLIEWDVQPLEGFESASIAELAARYDLLVLDHPHIGEAVAEDCLSPLDAHFGAAALRAVREEAIGPSFSSYVWARRPWALPLDVATQVIACAAGVAPPRDWDAVERLAEAEGVAQSLAGPHAILTLMSMVAGAGGPVGGQTFLEPGIAREMLERMHRLYARRPVGSEALNPIELLERMAGDGDITLIPLVFGYVTYARAAEGRRAIGFHDTIRSDGARGGVLGGTGIAITARAAPSPELLDHLAHLMHPSTQAGFIPAHDGQPSARSAWGDAGVNDDWGGFYAATAATAEHALLRPRFDGYIAFQTRAAALVRDALERAKHPEATLDAIQTAWIRARDAVRGPLDNPKDRS